VIVAHSTGAILAAAFARELAAHGAHAGEPLTLTVVDGDHHLAVRHPLMVARVLADTLTAARIEQKPLA
jgi:surfactin synthase thioesterase subunit